MYFLTLLFLQGVAALFHVCCSSKQHITLGDFLRHTESEECMNGSLEELLLRSLGPTRRECIWTGLHNPDDGAANKVKKTCSRTTDTEGEGRRAHYS